MFGDSAKEAWMWVGGLLVAAVILIFGMRLLVDNYIAPHDPGDPLTTGGLNRQQDPKLTK